MLFKSADLTGRAIKSCEMGVLNHRCHAYPLSLLFLRRLTPPSSRIRFSWRAEPGREARRATSYQPSLAGATRDTQRRAWAGRLQSFLELSPPQHVGAPHQIHSRRPHHHPPRSRSFPLARRPPQCNVFQRQLEMSAVTQSQAGHSKDCPFVWCNSSGSQPAGLG